jgi:uncharacterized protein involved in exopolysaccharide biosynthesis/Mrp family chromosome partitioning ATPase
MVIREFDTPAGAQPHGGGASGESVDIVALLRARWPLFRRVTLAVIGIVLLVLFALPQRYSTTAVIMLEPRRNNVTDQSSVLSELPTDSASIQNQIQLLTSRDLAEHVVDALGLAQEPEFANALPFNALDAVHLLGQDNDPERRRDAAVNAFLRRLSVEQAGLSTTIDVTFSAGDPKKAAQVANAVVDAYLDMQANAKFDVTNRTTAWLLDRIKQLGAQVQIAEASVQRYKAENNLNDTADGGSLIDQQLAAVSVKLVEARTNLAAKTAEAQRIETLVQEGRAADVSQIVSSPLIVQLREQQADAIRNEAELSARYGPRHPKLLAAQSQRRDLDAKIEQEVSRIEGAVQNDVDVARAQVQSLEAGLRQAERQAAADNMARVKLQSLEANAASTRSIYESFVTRLRETQGQDILQMIDARVISRAPVPRVPSWPPRLLVGLAVVPAAILLGILAILLAERIAPTLPRRGVAASRPARVADAPGREVPVLARLTAVQARHAAERVIDQPHSAEAKALRGLARRVAQTRRPTIVAVASLAPQDGQTAVAMGLARAATQLGLRVIFVDGNLRASVIASPTRLPVAQAGIVEVLSGTVRLGQSLFQDARSEALVLPVAGPYPDPRAAWASAAMQRLLDQLRGISDLVIIETAPMSMAPELPFVLRRCDAAILLSTLATRALSRQAFEYLDAIAAPPAGLVLIG